MKNLLLALLIILASSAAQATPSGQVLARLTLNLGEPIRIELVRVYPRWSEQWLSGKLVIRTIFANHFELRDVSSETTRIERLLRTVNDADREPTVKKSREDVCMMSPEPTPQLEVMRSSARIKSKKMQVILTNQSCAFDTWLAPKSPIAEQAAAAIYNLMLGAEDEEAEWGVPPARN